ncbi:PREDICTED: notchless protein homolog 1 [Trachymyrmex cornetzi]|uniref:Notchless protein like protein 1 n=1 Tax=Trachymyrmex cornetzi TaxID=471704 RepID=A0A195DXP8_9HYME|nr:PREDICTED: notchless protein homolog 1 [Trachymyrmex cornetzi]KYN17648.1 Notchless protein like protein 1 [Trachymyrmex cornetzi]
MSKRKLDDETDTAPADVEVKRVLSRFKSDTGEVLPGGLLDLPVDITVDKLQAICNALLQQEEEPLPLAFYVNNVEVADVLEKYVGKDFSISEDVVEIIYQPQAVFKVRAVTRCTGSLEGHKEAVISVAFSPDGKHLASGSGDATVRLWDIYTQTPHYTCEGHRHWVLCIAWSSCGTKLASACKNGLIYLWDPNTGKQIGKAMTGHRMWVTSLCWEPYHKNPECIYLASSSKDCDVRIWDTKRTQTCRVLSGHTKSVTCVKWGGSGLIYSASQDRTIKVWRAEDGILCRTLEGHAHWVNTLALNVDYVLRTGPFHLGLTANKTDSPLEYAKKQYEAVGEEKLVSGSDDFTLFLWKPEKEKKPIARMTGHQQLINDVKFSPDGRLIASASFDKSIKLWESNTGTYIASLRGHVQAIYSIAWSADSRLLVSGSADSTLKVWSIKTKKLSQDLPGHADEVYAVDWSPDGLRVASGGKDKVLRLWQN